MSQPLTTPVDHNRLVRLLRSGWTPYADEISAIMADAATQIESLMSQRKEWKCTVGNESFVTDQKDIAQDWRDDGLEVVSYFVPNVKNVATCATGDTNEAKDS